MKRFIVLSTIAWIFVVTGLHAWLNLELRFLKTGKAAADSEKHFRIGFLPVTCHLTCPVTHYINNEMTGDGTFDPVRFNGFPELKEAFLARYTQATFILAPLAMSLREQGVPIKIVYLGHRDGTALMVRKDSNIFRIEDLVGKTIGVPNRFSNQRLLLFRAFKERNLDIRDLKMLDMPPPDMPTALAVKAVDGVTSGEPFMAQTELDGYGRALYFTKDVWPNFISCVLAVHDDVIENRRDEVQRLVDGIARSGKWLDQSMDHRMAAADFVAKRYYNQHPRLLEYVLSKPPDRVKYTNLTVLKKDFDEIQKYGVEAGILKGTQRFEDYTDASFCQDDSRLLPYQWEAKK